MNENPIRIAQIKSASFPFSLIEDAQTQIQKKSLSAEELEKNKLKVNALFSSALVDSTEDFNRQLVIRPPPLITDAYLGNTSAKEFDQLYLNFPYTKHFTKTFNKQVISHLSTAVQSLDSVEFLEFFKLKLEVYIRKKHKSFFPNRKQQPLNFPVKKILTLEKSQTDQLSVQILQDQILIEPFLKNLHFLQSNLESYLKNIQKKSQWTDQLLTLLNRMLNFDGPLSEFIKMICNIEDEKIKALVHKATFAETSIAFLEVWCDADYRHLQIGNMIHRFSHVELRKAFIETLEPVYWQEPANTEHPIDQIKNYIQMVAPQDNDRPIFQKMYINEKEVSFLDAQKIDKSVLYSQKKNLEALFLEIYKYWNPELTEEAVKVRVRRFLNRRRTDVKEIEIAKLLKTLSISASSPAITIRNSKYHGLLSKEYKVRMFTAKSKAYLEPWNINCDYDRAGTICHISIKSPEMFHVSKWWTSYIYYKEVPVARFIERWTLIWDETNENPAVWRGCYEIFHLRFTRYANLEQQEKIADILSLAS